MAIERHGEYLLDRDLDGLLSVGIESDNLRGCIAEARRLGAAGVFGSPSFGFRETNLDFLAELPDLRKVWFWDVALSNVDGLYHLRNLRSFGVQPERPPIDFRRLPSLEEVVWDFSPNDAGIAELPSVGVLHVWHCNPRQRSFEGIALPRSLHELQFNWANPRTLGGIPALPNLRRFEAHRCRNLESIAELPEIAPDLEHLVVASCGRVADGRATVERLPKLQHAFVRDEVLVSKTARTK